MTKSVTVISIGGSILVPVSGFDPAFLKKFFALIRNAAKQGQRFVLIIGGGATARTYQHAAAATTKLNSSDSDWIGIHSTILNAQWVRIMLKDIAYPELISVGKKVNSRARVFVTGGDKPGATSDLPAVKLAKLYGAKEVLNLSNIACVYTKDPRKHADAQPIKKIAWPEFRREIVGAKYEPGMSAPFDPVASRWAEQQGLTVKVLDGRDLAEVKRALQGKPIKGTTIHP